MAAVDARNELPEAWASVEEVAAHVGVRKDSVYRWLELLRESASLPAVIVLSNALKFTEVGSVVVRAERAGGGEVALSVEDTGIGSAPLHHELVFEAFRQADGTTNRKYGGARRLDHRRVE